MRVTIADSVRLNKGICSNCEHFLENSSREWTKDALNQAVEDRLKTGKWTFTYLGTQPETWDEAAAIGFGVGTTAVYAGPHAGATYAATAHAVRGFSASPTKGTRTFFEDFADEQMVKDAHMTTDKVRREKKTDPDPVPAAPADPPKPAGKRWRK